MVAEQRGNTQWTDGKPADTSRTGAGIVADSEQPNPAGNKADLSEDEKSLAGVLASMAASKNSCAHVTVDQEVSVKTLAEELKTLADATQKLRSEISPVEGHACSLFQVCSFTVAHTTVDPKGLDVETMMRRLAQKEHSAAVEKMKQSLLGS